MSVPPQAMIILQIVGMVLIFYFIWFRPMAKERKALQSAQDGIRKGDEIVTAGGIVGKVKDVKDAHITIESGTATLVVERARIIRIGGRDGAKAG